MAIEPFELHDNLMLADGIVASGGSIIAEITPPAERYTSTGRIRALCRLHWSGIALWASCHLSLMADRAPSVESTFLAHVSRVPCQAIPSRFASSFGTAGADG
jgi:hypothetical protein